MMKFTVVHASFPYNIIPYNIILGHTEMGELRAVSSTIHAMMKFPTPMGITTLVARTASVFECRRLKEKRTRSKEKSKEEKPENQQKLTKEEILVNPSFLEQKVTIDMTRVPKRIIKHTLNVNMSIPPKLQKRRVLGTEKSKEVKVDGTWRMCIDFKNVNLACPKDYYPLLEIDLKIESVMGFHFKNKGQSKKDKGSNRYTTSQNIKGNAGLSDKLAALNRFLSKLAKQSLSFFETLKNIIKKNKDGYRWTEDAERASQEMKKLIVELPTLTTPILKETLYVYLATSQDAVSGVLLAERKGN
nr:hypothetical protein [Tanacetum cinerariifolium]